MSEASRTSGAAEVADRIARLWKPDVRAVLTQDGGVVRLEIAGEALEPVSRWLTAEPAYCLAGIVAREGEREWVLSYLFHAAEADGWIELVLRAPLEHRRFPSISGATHAADWHEREIEDHFGLAFEGHPRLGDFVLHDEEWPEGVAPMRRSFDGRGKAAERRPRADWRPRTILEAPGAFSMPIGPIYSDVTPPVHFLLETAGEEIVRVLPRLFYAYRGVEKTAEGRSVADAALLAERFAATQAFAHALAFCLAVERIGGAQAPRRAAGLRIILAELERVRFHASVIEAICASTGLAVAASEAAMVEEDLLRLSGAFAGHRYLFGLNVPGGLSRDLDTDACLGLSRELAALDGRLARLQEMLRFSSSFLDRLEQVGVVESEKARSFGLVGPVARASGRRADMRVSHPYTGYGELGLRAIAESEGDGYARLRLYFAEISESARIIDRVAASLAPGPVRAEVETKRPGSAFAWVEAPAGRALHWVELTDEGRVARHRIMPPSFANWHGFHLAAEGFAFQDFPIILATFGLSVPENDR